MCPEEDLNSHEANASLEPESSASTDSAIWAILSIAAKKQKGKALLRHYLPLILGHADS